ncbi:TrkA C-terminal domain-containing protein [Clostridium sp. D2Q-11]|uniref:TrkA C-terminal domain-containing protein n=1 Tax=Anaeromonas frigoriresistens TaxID=2683708 RepID=A0A942UVP7_9FIRM|nr:TrkA C-terminal domain-containing protein [Anaeromonas frigoriresistens]MBS4537761.1 TrkA C-terminal domain-containing protein [Anaeromonas frigoriresistens]
MGGIIGGVLILAILISVVEILSVALKMTGLDIEKARFQVISIITSTGFTTRESELIAQHKGRRQIAQILMLVSYVGEAAVIGLVLYILQNDNSITLVAIAILLLVTAILIFIRKKWIGRRLEVFIEKQLGKRMKRNKKYKTVDEVLKLNDEYGVVEFVIEEDTKLLNKNLKNSGLSERHIQVLNVDRASYIIHFPTIDFIFRAGDKVIVYGNLDNINRLILNQYKSEQNI